MEKIELKKIRVENNTIEYEYKVSNGLMKYFKNPLKKYTMEYQLDGAPCCIEGIPESVLTVPFVCNMLPLVWLADATLYIKCLDLDFYHCMNNLKQGYMDMYPEAKFLGDVEVSNIEENKNEREKVGLFFSGGLDAYTSLVRTVSKNPYLVSIWGADVSFSNVNGWEAVHKYLKEASEKFDLPLITVRSSFREIFDEQVLDNRFKGVLQDLWWHAVQHGIAIIGHAAPVAYKFGFKMQYIASSYSNVDRNVRCASYPALDNTVRYAGCAVYHEGFELTRTDKIRVVDSFCKVNDIKINLHVCWQNKEGNNCCMCEKCWRTMAEFWSQGIEPEDYGFSYNEYNLKFMKRYLELDYDFSDITRSFWLNIQKEFRKNRELIGNLSNYNQIKWIRTFDFYSANDNYKRKLYLFVSKVSTFLRKKGIK